MELIGSVEGKDVIIIDDCADTCGTLTKAASLLKDKGAIKIYCIATHPILSGKAFENLISSKIDLLVVSDTIKPKKDYGGNIIEVSCIPVLENVIRNLIDDDSISKLNE